MISNIFEFYYTTKMHPARLKPLSKDELCKGMPADAVDKYLSLVEQLYNAFAFDVNAEITPISNEDRHQKWLVREQVYNSIIKLLFKHDAISDDAYCELHKSISAEFQFTEHPTIPGKYVGDSLDDFRLAFEYELLECDPFIDLSEAYLDDQYGYSICVRPNTPNRKVSSSDLCIIRFEGSPPNMYSVEASYWEVRQLLKKIQLDIECNANEQKRLDSEFCKPNQINRGYLASLTKTPYGTPRTVSEWYTTKLALTTESAFLWRIEDQIKRIFDTMSKPTDGVGFGATLYIYKGQIQCHKYKHPLVSATAIIHDDSDREIELDVEYCPHCKRYMLNYTSYMQYRERHGLLIGKLKMISSNISGGEFEMASESPLKLCGYNVSQSECLAASTRQFLLAKIIHDGIMSKIDVIHYLERFININGAKAGNDLALEKWSEDLAFVHKYNKTIQPKVYIDTIKKY